MQNIKRKRWKNTNKGCIVLLITYDLSGKPCPCDKCGLKMSRPNIPIVNQCGMWGCRLFQAWATDCQIRDAMEKGILG